jgi:chondroitin AC lyase
MALTMLCRGTLARPQVPGVTTNDLDLVRARFVASLLPKDPADVVLLAREVKGFRARLRDDGSFADIDYANTDRSVWTTSDHLKRVLLMAKLARFDRNTDQRNTDRRNTDQRNTDRRNTDQRNTDQRDAVLERDTHLALQWWLTHDYQNSNWWWNLIGVPELLGEIGNLMQPELSQEETSGLVAVLHRSDWRGSKWTGANYTWELINQIARGLIENDPALVAAAYRQLGEGIRIVDASQEGIQQDDSFHQHGRQLYNGGYGLDFANDVGRFLSFAWGTSFEIPSQRLAVFSNFVLDGEQWMVRGDVIDYSTVGREITRPGKVAVPGGGPGSPISPAGPEYSLGRVVSALAAEPLPRQAEFQAFAARLAATPAAPELSGNRSFWLSDYMVHRRAGYMTSVKMLSTRMRNAEVVNGEGKRSVHLSDGANLLYLTGEEYKDIFPVWDWSRVPGTTALEGTLDIGEHDPVNAMGTTSFDGSVSDGVDGLAAMDLKRGGLTAKKAWFFFDDAYVALGAGITLQGDSQHAVATDVNQTLLSGDVMESSSTRPLSAATHRYRTKRGMWVYHDHVGSFGCARTTHRTLVGHRHRSHRAGDAPGLRSLDRPWQGPGDSTV